MDVSAAAQQPGYTPGCVHCFLTPEILDNIVRNGSKRQRDFATRTSSLTGSLRVARVGFNESLRVRRRARLAMRLALLRALTGAGGGPNKKRTIFDAHNTQRIGNQVRTEGEPSTGDPAVDEAYQFMGNTFDFFWNVYQRNSVDDEGMPLNGTVHFSRDYDNAFWDGSRMFYGDGDGEQFTRFTKSIDVIGHELTHGVTQYAAGLIYWDQPGALNESVSDVFGSLVKQYVKKQTASQADWLIGDDLFIPGAVQGVAIRSMKAPGTAYDDPVLGKDPQPAHMKDFVRTFQDSRGVHINSGIPNHAFYQIAVNLDGFAWEKAGLIWYETLNSPTLRRTANFQSFAQLTLATAQRLYPSGIEQSAVRDGWAKVGIKV